MATITTDLFFGPASFGKWWETSEAASAYYLLDDTDDKIGQIFLLPRSGSITDIGFSHVTTTGSPPDYQVSLETLTTNRRPSGIMYGGSAVTAFTPGTPGWRWVTLSTPATAVAGDVVAAVIGPTATAPSTSNRIGIGDGSLGSPNGINVNLYFTSAWLEHDGGQGQIALRYSDSSMVGIPAVNMQAQGPTIDNASTPDEIGAKFTVPFDCTIDGAMLCQNAIVIGPPFTVKLYDASDTLLSSFDVTTTMDLDYGSDNFTVLFAPVTLTKDTVYRLTMLPTSGANVRLGALQMISADTRALLPGGLYFAWTQRTDAGSWTDDDTKLPWAALRLTSIEIPMASAGGGAYAFMG